MRLPNIQNLDIRRAFAGLVADLKARRLLPAVAVLVLALVAIPVLLSRGASQPTLTPLPPTNLAIVQPSVHRVSHHIAHADFLRGPAHDPFVAPPATKIAAKARSSQTTTGKPTAATRHVKTSTQFHHHVTAVSTNRRRTPVREYVTYRPQLGFGHRGGKLAAYNGLERFAVLSQDGHSVLLYLGMEHNGKTAVFLIPSTITVSGEGRCSPSAEECRYLTLSPGEHVLLRSQTQGQPATEYTLNYRSVRKTETTHKVQRGVDAYGRAVVSWAAGFLAPLKSLRFAPTTGLLTINLHSLVPAQRTLPSSDPVQTTTTDSASTNQTSTTG